MERKPAGWASNCREEKAAKRARTMDKSKVSHHKYLCQTSSATEAAHIKHTCTRIRGRWEEGKGTLCMKWEMCLARQEEEFNKNQTFRGLIVSQCRENENKSQSQSRVLKSKYPEIRQLKNTHFLLTMELRSKQLTSLWAVREAQRWSSDRGMWETFGTRQKKASGRGGRCTCWCRRSTGSWCCWRRPPSPCYRKTRICRGLGWEGSAGSAADHSDTPGGRSRRTGSQHRRPDTGKD